MTTPHAPAANAAPAAAPAAHAEPSAKKEGPGSKVWRATSTFLVVCVGILVLLSLFGAFVPMLFDSFGRGVEETSAAMVRSGQAVGSLSSGLRQWFNGISKIAMALIIGILPYAFGGFLAYTLWKKWKDGQGGGGGHPPAAPAAHP